MRDEYTIVKQMPVVLENLKEGKALKYPVPRNVTVRFRGNGWSLAGLYFSPDVKYFIDLSSLGADNFVVTGKDLLEHIKLPVSLEPLAVKPDTFVLALTDYSEKRIPVVTRILLDYRDGYGAVGPVRLIPESVVVGGSEEMIGSLTSWPTIYRKFSMVRTPLDVDVPLEEPENYSVDVLSHAIRLEVNVQPFAEKALPGIPITVIAPPPNREVIFIPPRMDIIVRGGIDQLAKLTAENFQATVNYQNLVDDSAEAVMPTLTGPSDVKIVSRKPEKFEFIIRKRL